MYSVLYFSSKDEIDVAYILENNPKDGAKMVGDRGYDHWPLRLSWGHPLGSCSLESLCISHGVPEKTRHGDILCERRKRADLSTIKKLESSLPLGKGY